MACQDHSPIKANKGSEICRLNLLRQCKKYFKCDKIHTHTLPYQWEVDLGPKLGWGIIDEGETLENAYNKPDNKRTEIQTTLSKHGCIICPVKLVANFEHMRCRAMRENGQISEADIRRLSTESYATLSPEAGTMFSTQWTWYWCNEGKWKTFGIDSSTPLQSAIEAKYLHGQEVFRFEVTPPNDENGTPEVLAICFNAMKLRSLTKNVRWPIRRRPCHSRPAHEVKGLPYIVDLPEDWSPIDTQHEFELVPLNPQSIKFHLVASEFSRSLKHTVLDIFRVQNIHLWHKYVIKKKYMEHKGGKANEKQLFHGTADYEVVQSIFTQSFDWRCAGKHATAFGKGSYFALNSAYSDKYTGSDANPNKKRWMFMARVLVGEYARGQTDFTRPPLKPGKRDCYDSCVNDVTKPNIFVVFERDQCYPEYAICYERS